MSRKIEAFKSVAGWKINATNLPDYITLLLSQKIS